MADAMVNKVIMGSIALAVMFVLLPNLVLPFFNTAYNYTITGLAATTTQGIYLLVLVLALVGFAINFVPKVTR
jgi:hypothetical protein